MNTTTVMQAESKTEKKANKTLTRKEKLLERKQRLLSEKEKELKAIKKQLNEEYKKEKKEFNKKIDLACLAYGKSVLLSGDKERREKIKEYVKQHEDLYLGQAQNIISLIEHLNS